MIEVEHRGQFKPTFRFLNFITRGGYAEEVLDKYGKLGVKVLKDATPKDTRRTSRSWDYEIHTIDGGVEIIWTNSNINKGVPIAIILQYGHGTRNGGHVRANDYINPAVQEVFEALAEDLWREVVSA